jgi:hypothetical protein
MNFENKNKIDIECCATCKHCLAYPRNNQYGDIDYLCIISGYFTCATSWIYKDRNKVKWFSPGGRELKCNYERKE